MVTGPQKWTGGKLRLCLKIIPAPHTHRPEKIWTNFSVQIPTSGSPDIKSAPPRNSKHTGDWSDYVRNIVLHQSFKRRGSPALKINIRNFVSNIDYLCRNKYPHYKKEIHIYQARISIFSFLLVDSIWSCVCVCVCVYYQAWDRYHFFGGGG